MKANTPEKIYITPHFERRWFTKEIDDVSVEYVRTDSFVEDACNFINERVEHYMRKDKLCNVPLCPQFSTKNFIEDFKKYMKGE